MFFRRILWASLVVAVANAAGTNRQPVFVNRSVAQQTSSIDRLPHDSPLNRRPMAIAQSDPEHLFVANRSSGSISRLDARKFEWLDEWRVGTELTDLVHWKAGLFLVADFQQHRLKCVDFSPAEPVIKWQIDVVRYPVRLSVSEDGKTCFVAGLWSRQIQRVELGDDSAVFASSSQPPLNLSFAPGFLCQIGAEELLLVVDAFGDQFAALHPQTLQIQLQGNFASRRVGGIAVDPLSGEIVMTQQLLNRLARATRNDVHWGLMIANDLRAFSPSRLFERPFRSFSDVSSTPIGGTGDAKGDPGFICFSKTATAAIALGGVDQVALGKMDRAGFNFVPVGRRPMANLFSNDGTTLFVANHLDDSISVIDVDEAKVLTTIELGPPRSRNLLERGESLFFDARLSHDGWMSCHSCHVEGHTNGFLNDNFSDQSFGAPKRVLSLLGHGTTAPFAWNGSAKTLEEQITKSLEITMQNDESDKAELVAALTAFVRSLEPPPSLAVGRGHASGAEQASSEKIQVLQKGQALFAELGCQTCHAGQQLTSPESFDVGLQDELGWRNFNPPSLVGVSQRDRLFHDGRANNLREVLETFEHRVTRDLDEAELKALIAYLKTL